MIKKYIVIYYKNEENEMPAKVVHQSRAIDRMSFPEEVTIRNLSPKEADWDFAVIEERHYRIQ